MWGGRARAGQSYDGDVRSTRQPNLNPTRDSAPNRYQGTRDALLPGSPWKRRVCVSPPHVDIKQLHPHLFDHVQVRTPRLA